jgi:hypothetical protein
MVHREAQIVPGHVVAKADRIAGPLIGRCWGLGIPAKGAFEVRASARSCSSLPGRPTSCTPTASPSEEVQTGAASTGLPVMLNGSANMPVLGVAGWPRGQGGWRRVGVTKTSTAVHEPIISAKRAETGSSLSGSAGRWGAARAALISAMSSAERSPPGGFARYDAQSRWLGRRGHGWGYPQKTPPP